MRRPIVALALVLAAVLGLQAAASAQGLTCASFADQAGAQITLDQDPSDPNNLDADDDTIACEDFAYGPPPSTSTDVSTDDSGGTDVQDTSGDSGQTVTVPEPAPPAAPAPVDPGTGTDGTVPDTGAAPDAGATDGGGAAAVPAGEAAAAPAAAAPTSGVASQPVTAGSAVASLPNTGAGPAETAGATAAWVLVGALLLFGVAGVLSLRRA